VIRLDVNDPHLKYGWVKVYSKGGRERILPLGNNLKRDLAEYLKHNRPNLADENEQALFVTKEGSCYAKEGLATLGKTKLKKINVKGKYGPHKLRHTFATNYLRNGGNLEQLRLILGHRDISTTQRYLLLLPEDLSNAHLEVSPNDRILERMR
jgi:integrase/recombinase XerD